LNNFLHFPENIKLNFIADQKKKLRLAKPSPFSTTKLGDFTRLAKLEKCKNKPKISFGNPRLNNVSNIDGE